MSMWVKAGTNMAGQVLQFRIGGAPYSTNANSTIPADGSWKRITFTKTIGGSDETNVNIGFEPQYQSNINSGLPVSGDVIYVWGPQLEEASSAGRLITTYGTAITPPTKVKNLSSNLLNGTIDGAVYNNSGYFEFDGTNDKIETSSSPIAASPTTPFTMEAWAQISTLGSWQTVCSIGGSNTQIAFASNNTIRVGRNGGGGGINTNSGVTATTNTWYHIVGSYDGNSGNDIKIYVNGQLEANTTMGSNGNNNSSFFRVGTYGIGSTGGEWLNGKVGECRIYSAALSGSEVSQNFEATRGKYGV